MGTAEYGTSKTFREGMKWKKVMDTEDLTCDGFYGEEGEICTKTVKMGPRTVTILVGVGTPVPRLLRKPKRKFPKRCLWKMAVTVKPYQKARP